MDTKTSKTAEGIEFSVGDKVWWAKCQNECKIEPCPICFGKCVVTLILGNDERVQTPCDYCGKGWERARGYVQENYVWSSDAQEIVIDGKEVKEHNGVREVEYRYCSYILRPTNTFKTKEEAEGRVLGLVAEHEAEDKRRTEYTKEQGKKSYAWHVGYHKRCAARARKDLEYHEKKAITMKILSKS